MLLALQDSFIPKLEIPRLLYCTAGCGTSTSTSTPVDQLQRTKQRYDSVKSAARRRGVRFRHAGPRALQEAGWTSHAILHVTPTSWASRYAVGSSINSGCGPKSWRMSEVKTSSVLRYLSIFFRDQGLNGSQVEITKSCVNALYTIYYHLTF